MAEEKVKKTTTTKRKKTDTTKAKMVKEEKVEEVVETPEVKVDSSQAEIEALKAQIEMLTKMMATQQAQPVVQPQVVTRDIDPMDEEVEIVNITNGSCSVELNGVVYPLGFYGDSIPFTRKEVKKMYAIHRAYFTKPLIMIDDELLVKQLRLEDVCEGKKYMDDVQGLFRKNRDELERVLKGMPSFMKTNIVAKAKSQLESGELTDITIIDRILEVMGVDIR